MTTWAETKLSIVEAYLAALNIRVTARVWHYSLLKRRGGGTKTTATPLYTGGRVRANVNRATDQVMAQRANLLAQEESSFANAVNAYVGVIENRQLLQLQINNERVRREQLRSTNDRICSSQGPDRRRVGVL
jgi:outer membrane protein TolC